MIKRDSREFENQIERLRAVTGIRTQADFAKLFGVSQPSVCEALGRKRISDRWLLVLVERFGINPEWVRSGTLPKMLVDKSFESLPYEG